MPETQSEPILAFGPFKLFPLRKALFEQDRPQRLGSRAIDILTLLVERNGEVVSKEELFARAWPNTHVDEGNLRVNVAALRKTLGDGHNGMRYIINLPGRGYSFVAPVFRMNGQDDAHGVALVPPPMPNLPARLTRMIGRDDVVSDLSEQIGKHRFVTIVGPGGIGKTTVALAIARGLTHRYEHGVQFVDLAPLANAQLVPTAFASSLGLSIASDNPLSGLTAYLQEKSMLILLDNCEHVIGSAASVAEAVLLGAPNVHIMATSREPLKAEGEWVHRLAPMDVPEALAGITAAEAMRFPSVQLFNERAAASSNTFTLSDENASVIAELCRRLDGLPLAIELAAARINLFGIRLLAARLDDRLLLLSEGRRTALPRHQTLHATIDWSYSLLSADEQALLRSVSIYKALFSMEGAVAVATTLVVSEDAILHSLASLSEKSLLQIDASGPAVKYRLLDTTRAYAYGKLQDAGELQIVSRRHAERLMQNLTSVEADWDAMSAPEWLALYGPMIDDIRAALGWSLSPEGNPELAATLTAAAVPLWMHLSLINECRESVAKVLDRSEGMLPSRSDDTHRRMKLLVALGLSLIYTKGPGPQIEDALNSALALAQRLGDVDYQLRAVWGLFVATFNEAHYSIALTRARLFQEIAKASSNASDIKAGDRLLGFALHLLGYQSEARGYIEGMLKSYVVPTRRSDYVRFQYDQRVAARVPLSAILWLQGFADQAMNNAAQGVEEAKSINHALSLGYALSTAACPTAFLVGNLDMAERFVSMLATHSAAHGLGPWAAWGRYFKSMLAAKRGQLDVGIQGVAAALEDLRTTGFVLRYTWYLAEYADLLGRAGRATEGLAVIDEALSRCRRYEEGWCLAELLRIRGDLLLLVGASNANVAAEDLFLASLDHARLHATPAWELRTTTSLSRLRLVQDRGAEAQQLLSASYAQFTEGFESVDLVQASALLKQMSEPTKLKRKR